MMQLEIESGQTVQKENFFAQTKKVFRKTRRKF